MSLLPSYWESFSEAELEALERELKAYSHYPGKEGDLAALSAQLDLRGPRPRLAQWFSKPALRRRG